MTGSSTTDHPGPAPRIAVCTVTANNFLGRACVMARSLARFHPELVPFAAIADNSHDSPDLSGEPLRAVSLEGISIGSLHELAFGLRREQLAVAAKPAVMAHLLDKGFDAVIYIDPDMLVTSEFGSIIETVASSSVTLTPHLLDEAPRERELQILLSGTYNAGFIGVSSTGRGFLDWWLNRTLENPENDVTEGLYLDQRWLDLAPAMFEGVTVLRDRGVNVAYWNMAERPLSRRNGNLSAGGSPVQILHFSGFEVTCPEQASVHFGGVSAASFGPEAEQIFADYAGAVREADQQLGVTGEYGYAAFASGKPIPDIVRLIYRELGGDAAQFGDPFDDSHPKSFAAWLNSPASGDKAGSGPGITNLWERIYRLRPDVQAAYPDAAGDDREGFIGWTRSYGLREHGIGEGFAIGLSAR